MNKKEGKKIRIDPKHYECYRYGPLKLERIGRTVLISSDWEPKEFEKWKREIKSRRSDLKKEVDRKIEKILSLIEEFDPLELLATVAARNSFGDPEKYRESTYEGAECYIEYAESLILSQKWNPKAKHATSKVINQFNKLIEEVFRAVMWYFGTEQLESKLTEIEQSLRFTSISRYLFVRGDSYPEHHFEMIQDIFKDHDIFLEKCCGFNSCKVIRCIQEIETQLNNNINQHSEAMALVHELHELFKEFSDEVSVESFSSVDDIRRQYLDIPNPFEIIPCEEAPRQLLELLSSKFGENAEFKEFKLTPGWPTNDSIIYDRPLIKQDGKFYCFAPQVLFRNVGNILEGWIRSENNKCYQEFYQKKRAEYLDKKALEYLQSILRGAKVYGKLFYDIEVDGSKKTVETDGLILYDENLFIIEGKAGAISISAKRGGMERTKSDITKLIDSAYNQALRTKQYIIEIPEPTFKSEKGSKILVIKDKERYRNIYLINVTLQNLGHLSTQLPALKRLNFIRGKEWPWSVFVNDLRVISEIIEFPSEFLHFLQRRIRTNDFRQFRTMDELVFLMFYLYEGLYFENGILEDLDVFAPNAYTEDLDRYYDYQAGRVISGKKPRFRIPKKYKDLVAGIESTGKYGFTKVTTTLLSLNSETQHVILEKLKWANDASQKDGLDHDFALYLDEPKMGLMFLVSTRRRSDFWDKMDHHCNLKMYQTRFEEWILITICICKDGTKALDFRTYHKKWKYDPYMEEQTKKFQAKKMTRVKLTGKEVRRNDPCPCGSGFKYKRCCGK